MSMSSVLKQACAGMIGTGVCMSTLLCAQAADLVPNKEADAKFAQIEKSIFLYDDKPYTLEQAMAKNEVAGMSIVLIYDGKPALHRTYGLRVKRKDLPTNNDTRYQCASMSKMVSSVGFLTAARRGELQLDQSLSAFNADHKNALLDRWADKYFKDESASWPKDITLNRLLSHSAGLNVHGISAAPWLPSRDPLENILFGKSAFKAPVKPIYEPGTRYEYSGGGYVAAEAWLETATDKKFKDYMKERVLDPLGMTHSTFETGDEDTPNLAWGCSRGVCLYNVRTLDVKAAGGLLCHPVDYARLVALLMNGGKEYLFPGAGAQRIAAEDVTAMLTPSRHKDTNAILGGAGDYYGLGVALSDDTSADGLPTRFSHGGSQQGFSNEFYAWRDKKAAIVVMVNGDREWVKDKETYGGGTLSSAVIKAFKVAFDIGGDGVPLKPLCTHDTDCGTGQYCNAGVDLTRNECVAKKADNELCEVLGGGHQCQSGKCGIGRCYTPQSVAMGGTCYCDDACKDGKCSAMDGTKGSCVCKTDGDCGPGKYCDAGVDFKVNLCHTKLNAGEKCGKAGSIGNDHKCKSGECSGFPKHECK